MPNNKSRASSSRSGGASIVQQARKAAESAARDLQKRIPPDVLRELEKRVGQGQRTIQASLKQLETRLNRTASRQDVDRLTRRIDDLAKQVSRLLSARSASGAPSPPAGRSTTARRTAASGTAARGASGGPARTRTSTTRKAAGSSRPASTRGASSQRRTRSPRTRTTSDGTGSDSTGSGDASQPS